jgi:hypothetical protein
MNLCLNKQLLQLDDLFKYSELFLIIPFLSEEIYYNKLVPIMGNHNESIYTKIFFTGKNLIKQTSLEECDYSIVPFKYNPNDERINLILKNSQKYNKKVIAFYNDDYSDTFSLPDNLILFRSSIFKNKKNLNERIFPVLIGDHFSKTYDCDQKQISFCGRINTSFRYRVVEKIKNIGIKQNFILRNSFWASGQVDSKIKARLEYNNNVLSSKYTLCMSGDGNFSWRFYESLSFGRIPILIDTDIILPFEKIINWNDFIIKIKEEKLEMLPELIKNDNRSMLNNRLLWETYFSPEGYIKNFTKEI